LKICPKCGKKFPDEYGFCTECGFKLDGGKGAPVGKTDLKSIKAKRVRAKSAGTKRGGKKPAESRKKVVVQPVQPKAASFKVLVDGSNVIYYGKKPGSKPTVKNLQLMIKKLEEKGYQYIVFADPKTRWALSSEEKSVFDQMISQGTVKQVPATTGADRWFLEYATNHPEYKVLSNDRFVDWKNRFPWVGDLNRFIRFMILNGEVYLGKREGVTTLSKMTHRRRKEKPPKTVSKPSVVLPPPSRPLETEEMYTVREPEESVLKAAYAEPTGKPHVERESRGGPETEPSIKTGRGIEATSLAALVGGLGITWASIFMIAVPSVLYSVPAEVAKFIPQFSLFIFLAALGWFLSKKGVEEGPKVFGDVMKYSGLAMILALAAVVLMRWESGFSYVDPTFWFRLAYLGAVAVMGAKSFGMRKAGVY